MFFSQGPDPTFQDRIGLSLPTRPFLGLMVMLQESFKTALLFYGLRPADNGSTRYSQVLGYLAFTNAFFQQFIGKDDLCHLSHLHSFSWSVTF